MSHAFDNIDVLSSPFPSPLQPHSQSATPSPTPTQNDYDKRSLPRARGMSTDPDNPQPGPNDNDHKDAHESQPDLEDVWERELEREQERDRNLDKFAPLFLPSTPRASPVFGPTLLPVGPDTLPGLEPPSSSSSQPPVFSHSMHVKSHTSHSRPRPNDNTRRSRPPSIASFSSTSSQSDFGSFIEVPAFDDPLSADIPALEEDGLQKPMEATPTSATTGGITSSASRDTIGPAASSSASSLASSMVPPPPQLPPPSATSSFSPSASISKAKPVLKSNPSLSFFDTFTQDARQRSSAARSHLLDELLMHQDDPMWFVMNEDNQPGREDKEEEKGPSITPALPSPLPSPPSSPAKELPFSPLLPNAPSLVLEGTPVVMTSSPTPDLSPAESSIVDLDKKLDHDYKPTAAEDVFPKSHHTRHASSPSLLTRSGSMPVPAPKLAPPVASQLTASPPLANTNAKSYWEYGDDPLHSSGMATGSGKQEGPETEHDDGRPSLLANRGSSSSVLPTKWMSSLLRGGQGSQPQQQQHAGAKPSLESIFNQGGHYGSDENLHKQASSSGSPRRNTSLPSSHPSPHSSLHLHSHTIPVPSSREAQPPPIFSHSSAFAPSSVMHAASPFAAPIYIPPTGAPGFKGEGYDWDKGYSDELEVERAQENRATMKAPELGARTISVVPQKKYGDTETDHRGKSRHDLDSGGGTGSLVPEGRGGWGSGFNFGFGSMRASKGQVTRSPSSSILGLGLGLGSSDGKGSRSPSPYSHDHEDYNAKEREMDHPNANMDQRVRGRERDSGHDRESGWGARPDSGMGEFIERKAGNVELVGRKAATTPVLTPELAGMLRAYLPALARLPRSWTLIYSLDQHGISLNTLYTRCDTHISRKPLPGEVVGFGKGMLVAIKEAGQDGDGDGAVFGAWIAEGIRLNKGKGYSGGGESFLWKYASGKLKVFKATNKNNYVALCEPEYISFGGGDGHYGLYLDDTLFEGSSAPCPTFDNEPLCSHTGAAGSRKTVKFECVGLEVWGMGP